MTIHATPLAPFIDDCGLTVGPSRTNFLSRDTLYLEEAHLVHAVRQYTKALAKNCQYDNPIQFRDSIARLLRANHGDGPRAWDVRPAYLLHAYADYVPSVDCRFTDSDLKDCHAWRTPTDGVVVDVVTTLALTELAPEDDQVLVRRTLSAASVAHGANLVGVRLIVLDAPHESTFYDPNGSDEPLLTSPLDPFDALTFGGVR